MTTEMTATVNTIPLYAGRFLTDEERMEERAEGRAEGEKKGRAEGEKNVCARLILDALRSGKEDMIRFVMRQVKNVGNMNDEECRNFVASTAKEHNLTVPKFLLQSQSQR